LRNHVANRRGTAKIDRHKTSLPLLDRRHRLAGHPGEGVNFSFQGARLA
jgi:hypothetical protein